jgi:hypothetical protein
MGRIAPFSATLSLLFCCLVGAFAGPQATPRPAPPSNTSADTPNRVQGYTAWDDDFLYVALQINKPAISGKNTQPFSHPIEDDAAIVCIQADDDRAATKRTDHTVEVVVSAVGGAQLYSGANGKPLFDGIADLTAKMDAILKSETDIDRQQALRTALLGSIMKFAVAPKGAPKGPTGAMPGYTTEIAIPWADLGIKPQAGAKLGFNVVAQSTTSGSPPIQSLSPRVRAESDVTNPSLWDEIVLSESSGLAPGPGVVLCPRVLSNKPVVDAELTTGEWNPVSGFEFGERIAAGNGTGAGLAATLAAIGRPEFTPRPPQPVVPLPPAQDAVVPKPHVPQRVTPLVLARYVYWYQADTHRDAPPQHVLGANGAVAMVHHPLDGLGPWFSFDNADWHRRQLADIRRAGIDVILPVYRGDARDRQLYADKGLRILASALEQLRADGQDYPQVGLALDTGSMIAALGDRPDLKQPAAQLALYGMIRDFYRRIPPAFRCQIPLTGGNGRRPGCLVALTDATAFQDFDASFTGYARSRFNAEFGQDLVFVGTAGFAPKAGLDGYYKEAKEKGGQLDSDGWIKIATVSPGYDNSMLPGGAEAPALRSRRDGATYRADWQAAVASHCDWVLIDSWNDFTDGTEVAASLEFGYTYSDDTRMYAQLFSGSPKVGLKFLWHDAPEQMIGGATYRINVRLQNTGTEALGAGTPHPLKLADVWDPTDKASGGGQGVELDKVLLPGQNITVAVPVTVPAIPGSQRFDGAVRIMATETAARKTGPASKEKPADQPSFPMLEIPNTIVPAGSAPAWSATLLDSSLPEIVEAGGVYDISATLRNDGSMTWRKADNVRVTVRLYRTPEEAAETAVATADASAIVDQDVPPGGTTTVRMLVPVANPQGEPLPVWKQEDGWTYTARWEVAPPSAARTASDAAGVAGCSVSPAPIAVLPVDFGVRFTADATPGMLPADRRIPVSLSIKNAGPNTWRQGGVRVGYHWYYLDGTEYVWDDETTPIAQDVPPGGQVGDMLVWVTAPPCDGAYYLMWDVKFGGMWASTSGAARPFDQTVHLINVIKGRLTFADLTKAYTLNGITEDDATSSGDLDGKGTTFPAAAFPPYSNAAVAPCGIWQALGAAGPESVRRISFKYGGKGPKEKNFIPCMGQRVQLGTQGTDCKILHLAAASTGREISSTIKLIFKEPTSESEDIYAFTASRWDGPPMHGEKIAFRSARHHDRTGVVPGPITLFHYAIPISQPRKLIAVQLPNAPELKIGAITLER